MGTLVEDLTDYITDHPYVTVKHLIDAFGAPIHDTGWCGTWKTYTDLVFLRNGQFAHVQHRSFGDGRQIIRVREVEPMETVTVETKFVPASGDPDGNGAWSHDTGLVPDVEDFLRALSPTN